MWIRVYNAEPISRLSCSISERTGKDRVRRTLSGGCSGEWDEDTGKYLREWKLAATEKSRIWERDLEILFYFLCPSCVPPPLLLLNDILFPPNYPSHPLRTLPYTKSLHCSVKVFLGGDFTPLGCDFMVWCTLRQEPEGYLIWVAWIMQLPSALLSNANLAAAEALKPNSLDWTPALLLCDFGKFI